MISSILPTYSRAPLSFVKGEGSWLIEADGRRFLDMGAGIAVNVLGHAHPALVQVLTAQAQDLWHVSNLYQIPQQQALADELVDKTFADTVFFTNSGTETAAQHDPDVRGLVSRALNRGHRRRRIGQDDPGLWPADARVQDVALGRCGRAGGGTG